MKLHYHPLSSYSRKTAIGIGLRGDPVETVSIDVFSGGLSKPEYRALNPFGKMPVLETPDGPIFESTSILEYLESLGPAVLMPAGQERQARHWDRLGDLYLLEPIGEYFWRKSTKNREEAEKTTATAWGLWENALADGRAFLLGEAITLADLSAAVAVDYAQTEGLTIPYAILAYRDRLYANPVLAASRAAAMPFVEGSLSRRMATVT